MPCLFSRKPLMLALSCITAGPLLALGIPKQNQLDNADNETLGSLIVGRAGSPHGAVYIAAQTIAALDENRIQASGNVEVKQGLNTLNSDAIEYDQANDTLSAQTFTLQNATSQLNGEDLRYQVKKEIGSAKKISLEIQQDTRRFQSTADEVQLLGDKKYQLNEVKLNTCDIGDDSWHIHAQQVDIDEKTGVGVAKHARFVFGKVSLFYTPWLDFPIHGNRKSGLLIPSISTGSNALDVTLPYYFNLASNQDLTLLPALNRRRGVRLGFEWRHLGRQHYSALNGQWQPFDLVNHLKNRYHVNVTHNGKLLENQDIMLDFHQASDNAYYHDFFGENEASNQTLNRQVRVTHESMLAGSRVQASINVQKYQILSVKNDSRATAPYALLPEMSVSLSKDVGDALELESNAEATRFTHPEKPHTSRFSANLIAQGYLQRPWGFVRPKFWLNAAHYRIDQANGSQKVTRVLPNFHLDSGLVFEKTWRNLQRQTLEPRLFYAYTPSKNQSRIPLLNSALDSFHYEQLFRNNRFIGVDRMSPANFVSAALQSRLFDSKTGLERLNVGVGQQFYFSRDMLEKSGQLGLRQRKSSDIAAFLRLRLGDHVSAMSNWYYNQELRKNEHFDAGLSYETTNGQSAGLRYQYARNVEIYNHHYGKMQQVDAFVRWPIAKNTRIIARHQHDVSHNKVLQQALGFEYQSACQCWGASLLMQRYVSGLDQYKNAVFFQLQLRHLGGNKRELFKQVRSSLPVFNALANIQEE